MLWGSNAREAHPIFFHHVMKGVRKGAALYVVDPRRSPSARFADVWLGIDVGSDISLANAIGREIIRAGLTDTEFVRRATTGFDAYAEAVEPYTLERAERDTGVPSDAVRRLAHAYATADRAQLCWTLGITEHHNATDNVRALVDLALLTGHVGRYGAGLVPLRGQNNVQGGGDMGALPNKLPGFQDVEADVAARDRMAAAYGVPVPANRGWHIPQMFDAMERGALTACYVLGENPVRSEADSGRVRRLLGGLEHLVVQDLYLTDTAELADVVLPSTASWCETEGTVTSSERRVQRVRKALEPPGEARDDLDILCDLARRLGAGWKTPTAEEAWDELRTLSPMHAGMSYRRLEDLGGIQWPCPHEDHPGTPFLHGRLWEEDPARRGAPAPFAPVQADPPVEPLSADFPVRLTTGRRLESFNTGVQSAHFLPPTRRPESIDLSPEDAAALGVAEGERVLVSSARATVEAPVHLDAALRPGLAFMAFHSPEVPTNALVLDAWDRSSGTAEFKAVAVRVERTERVERVERTAPAEQAEAR